MPRRIRAADLFCGAGGSSTGLLQACEETGIACDLLAVDHWDVAVQTHSANHPGAHHLCVNLDSVEPTRAVPGGKLDILLASPECTHHSTARGGKPMCDQSRASAWHVLRWAESLRPETVIVENVQEFTSWGPLGADGRPLKRQKGAIFQAWIDALRSLGYRATYRVLNAADYGAATTRRRLFVIARRGRRAPVWPDPSHAKEPGADLFAFRQKWRAAREVIDWKIPGKPAFGRERPLKPRTIARILAGIKKFAGEGFATTLTHEGGDPLPTITGDNRDEHAPSQFFQAFTLGQQSGSVPRSTEDPLPTISTDGAISLCRPFLVQYHGRMQAHSVDDPLRTVDTRDRYALVEIRGEMLPIQVLLRMLQPHELAAAMSFPREYRFVGNKAAVIKQIGNAVDVRQAKALCLSQLVA